eukprot:5100397-Amphidinium_carterae.2
MRKRGIFTRLVCNFLICKGTVRLTLQPITVLVRVCLASLLLCEPSEEWKHWGTASPEPELVEIVPVEETNLPAAPFVVGPHQR